MKTLRTVATALSLALLTSSCQYLQQQKKAPEITYSEKAPKFDVKKYFSGDIEVAAITQDAAGKITNTFTAKANGKWEENRGTVQYNYTYEGGKKDSRTWLITAETDGTFTMVAHDITTPGSGKQVGNAGQFLYTLLVPYEGTKQNISFEDSIYLVDDRSAIGVSNMNVKNNLVSKSIISYKKVAEIKSDK